jgi:hypothetical protein
MPAPAQALDLVEGVDHDVAEPALDRVIELGGRLVVPMQVEARRVHTGREREV